MHPSPSLFRLFCSLVLATHATVSMAQEAASLSQTTSASTSNASSWQDATEDRLKAVYDRGEFRARDFQAEWLPDSSGYIVTQRDPETNKLSKVIVDVQTGERRSVQPDDKTPTNDPLRSPDGKQVLQFRNRQIFVRELDTDKQVRLTDRDTERDIRYYDAQWSPDGARIVFVESDSTDVRQRAVLVPDDPSYPGVQQNRFARVGEKLPTLRVGVVNHDGSDLQWLPIETPADGMYLGQVQWAGNSDEVLVEKLSRFRDVREFLIARIDGDVTSIYKETNDAWAVGSQGKNSGLVWLRDGNEFVVVSEKDGWRHAFRWSRAGEELAVITPGPADVIDRAVIDEEGGWYYFYASPANGTQKHLYRVPLAGVAPKESGGVASPEQPLQWQRITPADQGGTHTYRFSPDAKYAFHTFSTLDSPPLIELVELPSHRVVRVLEDNRELRQRMKQIVSHPTEFLQLDIGDGVTMDAWMIKPKDFDETKKYPVFVYVYGEPYAQTVLDEWGAVQIDFHRVVADQGYLVVSIDNRGTPAPKGAAWRRSVFGSLGPLSTEEQAAGLKELGRMKSFVDLSRVGIWGWSGGGSNTLNAMFRKPDSYHVGIAVVPKPQPHLYNAWFQEIYMRTREVNPDGYETAAAINFADGLKGKLLIITGSGETNTHIQIIEGLVDRMVELGKAFDYMVYPNRDHGLAEGVGTKVHVRMLIIRYLRDHLPPGPR